MKRTACLSKFLSVFATVFLSVLSAYGNAENRTLYYNYYVAAQKNQDEGDFLKAFENANLAIRYAHLAKDSTFIQNSRVLLATLYYLTGQGNESFALLKSIDPKQIKNIDGELRANYYAMSAYYSATIDHDFSTSFRFCDSLQAYHKKTRPKDKILLAHDRANIAELYILNSDTSKAWEIIRSLDKEMSHLNDGRFSQQHYANKARLFQQKNEIDSAVKYANLLLTTIPSKLIDPYNGLMMLTILMRRDSLNGNMVKYIGHRNDYDSIKHTVHGNEIKYQLHALQGEWKALEIMQQAKNDRRMSTVWIVFLSIIAVLAALIGFLFYRNRKNQHELALLECDRLDNEVSKREMENLRLRDELQDQHSQLDTALQKTAELKVLLATRVNDNPTDGEEVINLLRSTQPDFLPRLRKAHPNLNHNDEVLIAMIRLDLTTADMAAALNITPESLIKARYRLRKKMDIASSKELNQTIMQL